jgi:FkbM family methyltransferase
MSAIHRLAAFSSLPRLLRSFDLSTTGVLHVGANDGSEIEEYARFGIARSVQIEALPIVYQKLQARAAQYSGHRPICALVTDQEGQEMTFNVANNRGESSSIFAFGSHKSSHPEVGYVQKLTLRTTTVDRIMEDLPVEERGSINSMCIDTQGSELLVLKGATRTLPQIDLALIEVSDGQVYSGGAQFDEIETFMAENGFDLVYIFINAFNWGEAFFVRRHLIGGHLRR